MVVPVVVLVCGCVPQQKRMTQLGAYHARMVRCTHSSGVQQWCTSVGHGMAERGAFSTLHSPIGTSAAASLQFTLHPARQQQGNQLRVYLGTVALTAHSNNP